MRPPYYNITARCENKSCEVDQHVAQRKRIVKTSTGGYEYEISVLACPKCRCWGPVLKIEEIS